MSIFSALNLFLYWLHPWTDGKGGGGNTDYTPELMERGGGFWSGLELKLGFARTAGCAAGIGKINISL